MYGNPLRRHVPKAFSLFRIFQKRLNVPSEAKHQEGIERFPEEKGKAFGFNDVKTLKLRERFLHCIQQSGANTQRNIYLGVSYPPSLLLESYRRTDKSTNLSDLSPV
ncbi:hypothetical protein CEXT_563371 [Caerostris extrusa]|uniref:Uncharacterized protein n=1 Tax=Caerostris extrusa TaxID=172846 RepID=A0AAV4XG35_CAEEX|nr:hypothetical protein CEXT_563371 [Caerostris extrusa]